MKKLLWFLLKKLDNNWGYSTPLQERFENGELCYINQNYFVNSMQRSQILHKFSLHEQVKILETGRHDYLVESTTTGKKECVFQFQLNKS